MSENINSESLSLYGSMISGQEISLDTLKSNSDISYRIINNFEVTDKEIIQSKLDGSIIKNCKFIDTNLSKSDLNAVRIENCLFNNVNFSSADIMSSILSNCKFLNCDFKDAQISDCIFTNTNFDSSSFMNCSFLQSSLKHCSFYETSFKSSTIILNKYYETSFNNMSLGNCTFEYHIMRDCEFNSVTLNTDSIAYLYGCTVTQLNNINLIFLGKKIGKRHKIDEQFLDSLFQGFIEKHWFLGAILLKMNFKFTSIYNSLESVLNLFFAQNKAGFLIKANELQFVINILYELKETSKLPILILDNYICKIDSLINKVEIKNQMLLLNLKNIVILLKNLQEEELYSLCDNISVKNQQINAELIFKESPKIAPDKFLSDVCNYYSVEINILGYRKGSYIVTIACSAIVLRKILKLIKDLTGNLLEIYNNVVILKELVTNSNYREEYNKNILNKAINKSDNNEKKQELITNISINIDNSVNVLSETQCFSYIVNSIDYGGYGKDNFHRINYSFKE